jgi:hypothetical protein
MSVREPQPRSRDALPALGVQHQQIDRSLSVWLNGAAQPACAA